MTDQTTPVDRRPYRQMYSPGPTIVVTTDTYRLDLRQVGWLGQTGAFYSLDENPLQDSYERGGVAPLYFPAHSDRLADLTPDPTTADDPTPLRWGLNDVLWGDDDTITVCMSGPDREPYWLELTPDQAAALRDDLAGPDGPHAEQPIAACVDCNSNDSCNGICFAGPSADGQHATQPTTDQTARAQLAALVGYEPGECDPEFEKRVDALIAASLHEAARRMEGAGYDDDAVNFLDLLAARQTAGAES